MPSKKTTTKDDWLRAAMELLRTRGIGGVRVLTLAQNLRVSRGSFYWHFEDRQDLLRSMLDWWEREMTDTVIELESVGRGSPQKRLTTIAACYDNAALAAEKLGDFDRALEEYRYSIRISVGATDARTRAARLLIAQGQDLRAYQLLFLEAGNAPLESEGELLSMYLMARVANPQFVH